MRRKTLIFFFSFVIIFVVAEVPRLRFPANDRGTDSIAIDSLKAQVKEALGKATWDIDHAARQIALGENPIDSVPLDSIALENIGIPVDTAGMDSLQKAIWMHNKVIDDSLRADSLNRQRKNGIDAPVEYTADDSMVYEAGSKLAYLYGKSHVKYENMDLESDKIYMSMDSSLVHATGSVDSTGKKFGTPVFKMGSDTYENDTMAFNFKTKKGLITNVYTAQQDGYMTSQISKRDNDGNMYLYRGRYTTCNLAHPDFYFAMSRAKVRPGKDVVFGPAYLVVADVPLPLAIPYGFFPFTKSYSSGFIMPSYGDESSRGFYLKDGGYYFAISDKVDLKLTGEIYTKGSWGIRAQSTYAKRYRYRGSFNLNYQNTVTGEKNMPDYTKSTSFQVQWSHNQDQKANPYRTLSASVNFATSNFEKNNINSYYNPQALAQSTRASSVSMQTTFSSIGMSLSSNFNIEQNMRDSTLTIKLPDISISVSRFYPFKAKKRVGAEKWYEKISMQYTGHLTNSITNFKESKIMSSSLTKDWRNGFEHSIQSEATFTAFKYVNLTPRFSFRDKMLTQKYKKSWDEEKQKEVSDTLTGFYNMYDWDMSIGMNTKLYGFYVPNRKIFGNRIDRIRHVFTPTVSFTYAPSFRRGNYETYTKTNTDGTVELVEYSPYTGSMFSPPNKDMRGSISLSLSNNVEMKWRNKEDSLVKVSLIDELGANISYNMAAKEKPWSDLTVPVRIKFSKSYTFNMTAAFSTYAYEVDSTGRVYVGNHTEWSKGRFGRFQGMSQTFNYSLDNKKVANFFKWLRGEKVEKENDNKKNNAKEYDTGLDTNIDPQMEAAKHGQSDGSNNMAETDEEGYMKFNIPWNLNFSYGISMRENTSGTFNYDRMRYPYKITQTLNVSGNIRLSDGWDINFSSGYDFENKKVTVTTMNLSRDLHCFNMSATVNLAPYTSYNFTFRCNAATLADALKYDKQSGTTNAVQWY